MGIVNSFQGINWHNWFNAPQRQMSPCFGGYIGLNYQTIHEFATGKHKCEATLTQTELSDIVANRCDTWNK